MPRRPDEEAKAHERLRRVRRAFQDGMLDAEDWREQKAELEAEIVASTGKLDRLAEHEQALKRDAIEDAEEAVVQRLSDIRTAIAGTVTRSENVAGVQRALEQLFESFTVGPADAVTTGEHAELLAAQDAAAEGLLREGVDYLRTGQWQIVPIPRDDAFRYLGIDLEPVLRREPLQTAHNNVSENCR